MLYARPIDGKYWLESDANDVKTRHLIVNSDAPYGDTKSWDEIMAVVPTLNEIIGRFDAKGFAMVTYSNNGLSVSFHAHDGADFPESIANAQRAVMDELGITLKQEGEE